MGLDAGEFLVRPANIQREMSSDLQKNIECSSVRPFIHSVHPVVGKSCNGSGLWSEVTWWWYKRLHATYQSVIEHSRQKQTQDSP